MAGEQWNPDVTNAWWNGTEINHIYDRPASSGGYITPLRLLWPIPDPTPHPTKTYTYIEEAESSETNRTGFSFSNLQSDGYHAIVIDSNNYIIGSVENSPQKTGHTGLYIDRVELRAYAKDPITLAEQPDCGLSYYHDRSGSHGTTESDYLSYALETPLYISSDDGWSPYVKIIWPAQTFSLEGLVSHGIKSEYPIADYVPVVNMQLLGWYVD